MFGHKHDWQMPEGYKSYQETRPYGNQGFVRTIYFYKEKCAKCGEQRKQLYNDWIHIPENDPDLDDKYTVDHASIIVMGGLGYEKVVK